MEYKIKVETWHPFRLGEKVVTGDDDDGHHTQSWTVLAFAGLSQCIVFKADLLDTLTFAVFDSANLCRANRDLEAVSVLDIFEGGMDE